MPQRSRLLALRQCRAAEAHWGVIAIAAEGLVVVVLVCFAMLALLALTFVYFKLKMSHYKFSTVLTTSAVSLHPCL